MSKLIIILFLALTAGACGLAMDNEDRLLRGEAALTNGDYRTAIIEAKDVLRDEPDSVRGRLLLGLASVQLGDGASAEKELRRAVSLGARFEDIEVALATSLLLQEKYQQIVDDVQSDSHVGDDRQSMLLIRADAFAGVGETEAARDLYTEVLKDAPESVAAQLGIASSYAMEQNFGQARAMLDRIIATYPENIRGWLASGESNFLFGDTESALANFEVANKLAMQQGDRHSRLSALAGLAESQLAMQRFDEARETVNKLEATAPNSLRSMMLVSRVAYLDEDWGAAQQQLQVVLRNAPDYKPAQLWLGAVHLEGGNLSQAEMYLSSVVAATPDNDDARRLLAEARLRMDELDEAEETLRPLISRQVVDPRDLAIVARARLKQGDTDTALDFLRRSSEELPENAELKFEYAMALLQAGRSRELSELLGSMDVSASKENELRRDLFAALSILIDGELDRGLLAAQQLVEKWPASFEAHNLLGTVQLNRSDMANARKSFEDSLKIQSGNLTAQRYLAAIDESNGRSSLAQDRYKAVLAQHPDATWAMFALARLAARGEDLDLAQDWLQKIREIDDTSTAPRAALASILLATGEVEQAEEVLLEALQVDPASVELQTLLGKTRISRQDLDGAVRAFRAALEIEPTNAEARVNLANSLQLAGDTEQAEQTLQDDTSSYLEHIPSAISLALLKMEANKHDEAMRIAKSLQRRYPNDPTPYALEAEVHVKGSNIDQAIAAYDRAFSKGIERNHAFRAHALRSQQSHADKNAPLEAYLAERPLDSDFRMALAQALQRDNEYDAAAAEYETVVSQDPHNTAALNNLAWVYYLAGDGRATQTARLALSQMPESGAVADTLGWILLEDGNVDEAVDVLQQAVQLSRGRAEVRYHYAVALSKQGKGGDALRVLQDVIATGEEFASRDEAKQLLDKLQDKEG